MRRRPGRRWGWTCPGRGPWEGTERRNRTPEWVAHSLHTPAQAPKPASRSAPAPPLSASLLCPRHYMTLPPGAALRQAVTQSPALVRPHLPLLRASAARPSLAPRSTRVAAAPPSLCPAGARSPARPAWRAAPASTPQRATMAGAWWRELSWPTCERKRDSCARTSAAAAIGACLETKKNSSTRPSPPTHAAAAKKALISVSDKRGIVDLAKVREREEERGGLAAGRRPVCCSLLSLHPQPHASILPSIALSLPFPIHRASPPWATSSSPRAGPRRPWKPRGWPSPGSTS